VSLRRQKAAEFLNGWGLRIVFNQRYAHESSLMTIFDKNMQKLLHSQGPKGWTRQQFWKSMPVLPEKTVEKGYSVRRFEICFFGTKIAK